MNTARLYEFLVLAKVLNYSKAAKALYISQSVLSRHMQELEKEFGCAMLVRSTHGVTLTEAGRVLANDGGALIKKCESALSKFREIAIISNPVRAPLLNVFNQIGYSYCGMNIH